ncbi:MAG: LysM peptidoglycan-binding domain-containing protein [Burkholderiales bacterium]|nr:LysM peptidoglycan-binding domain-containing protein [Burkholderiales bacterium]
MLSIDPERHVASGAPRQRIHSRVLVLVAAVVLLAAGCATPPPEPAPAPAPQPVAPPPPPVVEAPKPAPPPVPELTPAQAKAQAHKLTIEAITQLQNGDEPAAQKTLEDAFKLDPANDLAKKLTDQIKADPQKELGTVFFRYTVQRDDSLSKLAQQYLGDRYRFHILAKYNDIANPSKLAAGQVIKIPGRQPTAAARPPAATAPEPVDDEAAKAATPETSTPRSASVALMQQGAAYQKAGNLEGAYEAYREAAARDPANRDAAVQRDSTRNTLARRYERQAALAFQRQNLDDAIANWDRVLALEPNNQKAKLERERALDLRKKLAEKFGAK